MITPMMLTIGVLEHIIIEMMDLVLRHGMMLETLLQVYLFQHLELVVALDLVLVLILVLETMQTSQLLIKAA